MAHPDDASPLTVTDLLDDTTRGLFRRLLRDASQELIEAKLIATMNG